MLCRIAAGAGQAKAPVIPSTDQTTSPNGMSRLTENLKIPSQGNQRREELAALILCRLPIAASRSAAMVIDGIRAAP